MKRFLSTLMLMLIIGTVWAQEKGSSTKAQSLLEDGDLKAAKTEIDNAIGWETYKLEKKGKEIEIKPKTLYVKGLIYGAIATAESEEDQNLAEDALKTAVDAYSSVLEQEKEGSIYYVYAQQEKNKLYQELFNSAVEKYNANDIEGALTGFEKVIVVMPSDTNTLVNTVQMAFQAKEEEKVEKYANMLVDIDYSEPYLYSMMASFPINRGNALMQELSAEEAKDPEHPKKKKAMKEYDEALEILKKGKEMHPADPDIASSIINLYIRLNRVEEAIESINESIKKNPEDKVLVLNKGLLNEKLDKTEEAIKSYKQAIEIDPDYFDARYSLGALYYNQAAEYAREINEIGFDGSGRSKDPKKEAKLEDKIKEKYKEAIPHFEKAHEVKPEDEEIISLLARMYNVLGMKEKYEAMVELMPNEEGK